jgi:hypothetical protein
MLTEDMTRLCGEINAMRRARGRMMTGLQHDAKELKQSVSELCTHFGRARMTMAKRTKNDRAAFLHNLKRTVGAHLLNTRNDLAGARGAWAGKGA